jgi:hypothetical protein
MGEPIKNMEDKNNPLGLPNQRYMPRWYRIDVLFEGDPNAVPAGIVAAGSIANGSVTINNTEFLLRKISPAIIGMSNVNYAASGMPAGADALDYVAGPIGFTFSFRSDSHVYMSDQVDVIAGSGSPQQFFDAPSPVVLQPKSTITLNCTTTLERRQTTLLQFVLAGLERADAYGQRL